MSKRVHNVCANTSSQSVCLYVRVCVSVCQSELQRANKTFGLTAAHEVELKFDKFESKKLQDIKVCR